MTIRAIETIYAGCRFRSRLEARWAVFFDELDIEWKYEAQGYEKDGERYLPDFLLPRTQTFVEVKGDREALVRDFDRQVRLHDFNGVLPDFQESFGTKRGLLLLGDIPYAPGCVVFHPLIQHHKGLHRVWCGFFPMHCGGYAPLVADYNREVLALLCNITADSGADSDASKWFVEHRAVRFPGTFHAVASAYLVARQARFEHGECAAVAR